MASPALPYMPSKLTQEAILEFTKQAYLLSDQQLDIRENMRRMDLVYQREVDYTAEHMQAKLKARQGDPTKFDNIVMPVVMPQVEAAVTYQSEVFLTGMPIFGTVSQPGYEDIALQIDSILREQQIRNAWVHNLTLAIRDGCKYNLMGVEVEWQRLKSFTPESKNQKEVIWEGNRIKRLDMYNTFWDTRVEPIDVSKFGEFAGYKELMSRIRLKQFIDSLPYNMNVKEAFESGTGTAETYGAGGYANYYLPQINPEAFLDTATWNQTDWMAWAGISKRADGINYKNMYVVTTLYGRIMPSDFNMKGLPGQNTPQVWKFIIVNNQVIVYAERLTNAHDLIPLLLAQPLNDGLGYQTKSFAQNVQPIQEITTAIANSDIAARRRALSDRIIYDSTKISPAAINNDAPNAHIPARPSATGQAISSLVYQFPFQDTNFQINQATLTNYLNLANQITGLNPVRQGQFVKGNKTRREFETVMGNSTGRDRLMAINLENTWFQPMKEIIKMNILQYQQSTSIFNAEQNALVQVDPVALRRAQFTFKLSDGVTPSEKLIDGETLGMAFQTIAQAPAIGAGYNITPMFSYLMKSGGADLRPFEKSPQQIAYEQAVAQWQQVVMQIMDQALKVNPPLPPEQIQAMLPPQPTPDAFGYVPGQVNTGGQGVDPQTGNQLSIIQQVMQVSNSQTQQPTEQPS